MVSTSKKRKRRREREKQTEELLKRARAISLVDLASPLPVIDPSTADERRQDFTNEKSNGFDSHAVDNPVSSSINLPKEPSWKRIDFVLPRADGKKRFVFDPQLKPEDSSQENGEIIDEKTKEYRKFETIEDILFASKRQKERVPQNNLDISTDQDEGSRKKAKPHDKNDNIISESQRRKLEGAFETVHQAENSLAIGNYVDVPGMNGQSGGEKSSSSTARKSCNESLSSDEKSKATLTTDDPVNDSVEKHQQRKKSISMKKQPPSPGQISGRTVKEAVRDKRGLRPRANSTDGELNLPQGGLCDERMILEAHKWNTERKFTNQTPPRGFHNLGNTCFLNATLQCLTYLPPFCQTLIAISNNKIGNEHNGGKRKTPQGKKITSSLCNLFLQAHGLNNNSSKGGPFAPKKVVSHLSNIGSCGSRNGYKFRLGRQEDAHEFLVHLLDAMNDGELRAAGINQTVSGWRDRLPVSRLDETTFVHRIFGGYFRSQVRCRKCNYKSNTYDPFLDLSLEVSKKSSTSVLKALSEFTRKETLDAANQWKCSGCKKYVCATKHLTVFRPPLTLCIQLKRFAFDNSFGFGQKSSKHHHGYGGGGGGGSKITKPIEFPGSLRLPLSDNRSCQYTLTGIVIHVGGSSQSGHYTAYVKKPGKTGTSQWYHMDDSHVQPVSEKTVLKQRDAYVLFYCRTEVKLEFPDPPLRSMSASEATEFGRTRAIARANSLPSEISKKGPTDQVQIDTDKDITGVQAKFANKKIPRSQQEIAVPCSRKEQKGAVHRVKTTIHPLGHTDPSPEIVGATKLEKGGPIFSSSSSSSNEVLAESHSNKHKVERKEKNIDTETNNDSDASSDDSSYNESSADSNSSSDSDLSSQNEGSDVSDNPSTNITHMSAVEQENEKGRSSKLKSGSGIESSLNDEGKLADNKRDDSLNSSKQSAKLEEEDSSESETDSEHEPSNEEKKTQNDKQPDVDNSEQNPTSTTSKRTQVVQNNTDSRGKVKVMLGRRKRKVWESVASTLPSKESNFQLLGNMKVSQWDDDNDDDSNKNGDESAQSGNRLSKSGVHRKRKNIIEKIDKQNRSRKRKMHLDRWDSHLDQGKLKKVKSASNDTPYQITSTEPKKNIFQKIQSGVQKMNRGKPKGLFRRKKDTKGSF
jgi:ubiquitin C-terminal hydrolase